MLVFNLAPRLKSLKSVGNIMVFRLSGKSANKIGTHTPKPEAIYLLSVPKKEKGKMQRRK